MEPTSQRIPIGRRGAIVAACAVIAIGAVMAWLQGPRRIRVVVPGRLIGGAWQSPRAMQRLIDAEKIRTIVTLTAINRDDPKYVSQARVVERTGVNWILIPMRGSTGTVEQMAQAADLMADPARQPVYFHCVAGHHRTSLAHAAYLIRHEGYSADHAWKVVSGLPWARPNAPADTRDRARIAEFAAAQSSIPVTSLDTRQRKPQELHAATP